MTHAAVVTAIGAWIVRTAIDGASEIDILAGVCERFAAAGVPLLPQSLVAPVKSIIADATEAASGARMHVARGAPVHLAQSAAPPWIDNEQE